MKIYLMTDMEGVCGVMNHDDWVTSSGRYFEQGKKLLTLEVNSAVEGFFEAGATEVYVIDGHGAGGINQDYLDSRTYLIQYFPERWPYAPLDASFDAIAFVGQHAKAGSEYAHIAHTQWFNYLDYKINGISVGEFGQHVMCGAFLSIPTIFGSGDEAFAKEARALVDGIEAVTVKWGITPGTGDGYDCEGYRNRNLSAIHMHPIKARELIYEGSKRALKRFIEDRESYKMVDINPPFKVEASYRPFGSTPAYNAFAEHPDNLFKCMSMRETKVNT